jgi:hypothetical protein
MLILPAGLLLCCGVLAQPESESMPGEQPAPEPSVPQAYGQYDEVVAELPRDQAPIASVALARINIALHQAKQRTEKEFCAGQWTPRGPLLRQYGPRAQQRDTAAERQEYWAFHSFRVAEPIYCQQLSRAQFFLEMSRHLPAWISIRPAGQLTAYQQGESLLPGRESLLAVR